MGCPETLLNRLIAASESDSDRVLYRILGDGEVETANCTFSQFVTRVRNISTGLRERHLADATVLLLMKNPLSFLEAFVACMWAGVIPVPAAIPRFGQTSGFIQSISANAKIAAVISDVDDATRRRAVFSPGLGTEDWLTLEQLSSYTGRHMESPRITNCGTAFLQYTSGSTGNPKGVIVTHANLMANQKALHFSLNTSRDTTYLSWLPLYHDMGLIGHALPAIYSAATCVIMPPASFLQKPIRWLKAISRFRATNSGGPNFAYELCIQKIAPEDRSELDLSCWNAAYNGGEPVRADTIRRFTEIFAPCGFNSCAMYPCYGLAEGTLVVTGRKSGAGPTVLQVSRRGIERGFAAVSNLSVSDDAIELVSSGVPSGDAVVAIVDPTTKVVVPDGLVGEIWTSSESVCAGYFRRESESVAQFANHLIGTTAPGYLRTGDLGFTVHGEFFVTGRSKDLIIVRGCNYYPQDLESTASGCNAFLAAGYSAAVSLESPDGSFELDIICELTRRGWLHADREQLENDVREAIAAQHGLAVSRVFLIRPGSLPRTSSGKVRRSRCKEMIRDNLLELLIKRSDDSNRQGPLPESESAQTTRSQ